MKRIAILGAGLSGLSAGYHLGAGYDIFERETEVGGLCRTMARNGFLFDYTGHLLHLRYEESRELVEALLPGCFKQHTRKAGVYTQQRWLDYPFQANIHALPAEAIKECILGFAESMQKSSGTNSVPPASFEDWVLQTFGAGVAKHFMFPYNRKLWRVALDELSADWVSWSIPKPTLDEFLNGALGIQNRAFGYNAGFLYPERGGIGQLPEAFAESLPSERLHLGQRAVAIDPQQRCVVFEEGEEYRYDTLISTLPLPRLLELIQGLPPDVVRAGGQLRYISVYDVNLGVGRANISDLHWAYFPENEFPFYRVGFPGNFSHDVVPEGCSSMYVEVSALPGERIPEQELVGKVLDGLKKCGILLDDDEVLVADTQLIECAYVIHDLQRDSALKTIMPFLAECGIQSIGRYGSWEYNSMEGAILSGKHAAETLLQNYRNGM